MVSFRCVSWTLQQNTDGLANSGGVTNSDLAMQIQADIGGFRVCRPHMRE